MLRIKLQQDSIGAKMATLNMGISYDLTYDEIDRLVADGRMGNYALGYLNKRGAFIVRYVGRSDSDLKERIKHGITDMETNQSLRYERFKFSYADTIEDAYNKECQNYHDFGGAEGCLVNKVHPAKPDGYKGKCPVCWE